MSDHAPIPEAALGRPPRPSRCGRATRARAPAPRKRRAIAFVVTSALAAVPAKSVEAMKGNSGDSVLRSGVRRLHASRLSKEKAPLGSRAKSALRDKDRIARGCSGLSCRSPFNSAGAAPSARWPTQSTQSTHSRHGRADVLFWFMGTLAAPDALMTRTPPQGTKTMRRPPGRS